MGKDFALFQDVNSLFLLNLRKCEEIDILNIHLFVLMDINIDYRKIIVIVRNLLRNLLFTNFMNEHI